MLDAADVLVDRHPLAQNRWVPCRLGVRGIAVAQEVPGRINEGVHRVGLALGWAATVRAFGIDPVGRSGERRLALRRVVLDHRQQHRKLIVRNRHDSALRAAHDRDWAAPVALAANQPVAQPVVDGQLALRFALEPDDDLFQRLTVRLPVELRRAIDEHAIARVRQPVRVAIGVVAFDYAADR